MGSLLGILTPASLAVFIISGHVIGFTAPLMHSLALGLGMMAVAGLVGKLRLGRATVLDYGQILFLLLAWAGLWTTAPGAPRFVLAHPESGLFACLLVSTLLPLVLGREPFTSVRSRSRAPQKAWDTPQFQAINRRMSWLWVGIFAASLASTLVPWRFPALDGPVGRPIFRLVLPLALLLGAGWPMNRRYPDRYLRRRGLPTWSEQARPKISPFT